MNKFLKRLFQIGLFFVALVIICVISITLFINPNQFKEPLEQYVLKQTGYTLKIEGPVVWRWFPLLSLQLNQITVDAPKPFANPFISSQSATVETEFLGLLSGKVLISLKLDKMSLFLEKNPNGQSNWEGLTQVKQTSGDSEKAESVSVPSKPKRFILNSINLQNGQVIFKDKIKNTGYKLQNLNLSAGNLFNGTSTPIALSFHVEDLKSQQLGSFVFSGRYSLQNSELINLQKLSLKVTLPDGKTTELTGEATVHNLNTTPLIQGRCEAENLNLAQWIPTLSSPVNAKASFKYQSFNLDISSLTIHSKTLGDLTGNINLNTQGLDLKGNFFSKKLKIDQTTIEDLKGTLTGKDNVFTIAPLNFQINKIPQHAALQIDARGPNPRYSLTAEGKGFEINQLLAIFNVKNKLEGNTRYHAKLSTTGKNINEWKQSLSGEVNIEIANGKFYGMDLISLLKSAQSNVYSLVNALLQKQAFNLKNIVQTEQQKWINPRVDTKAFTPFNTVKATININNGILKNPDLLIDHSEYKIAGSGTVDLNYSRIQYQASALLKNNPYPAEDKVANYLYTVPIPIKVTDTLGDPKIRPDLETYTNTALTYAQKHLIQKAIDKAIDKAVDKGVNKVLEQLLKH